MAKSGTYLRAWRKHRDLSLVAVGERINKSHGQLSRIERGESPYDQNLLESLAELYNCTVVDLLTRDPGSPASASSDSPQAFDIDADLLGLVLEVLLEETDLDLELARIGARNAARVYRALAKVPGRKYDRPAVEAAVQVLISEFPAELQ